MNREEIVLEVKNLRKRYGKSKDYALDDVSFLCRKAEIVGLVGMNGAGKSTTIKCVTGFLPFEEGEVQVCGFDINRNPLSAKSRIGYVPDNRAMFEKMTGMEYLNFLADVYQVPKSLREQRLTEFQSQFKLGDKIFNLISSYSHGMRQKICLMASLIHEPKLWILDEPLTGLDPQTSLSLRRYMQHYRDMGNTVLFSSHNLDVVEKLCDRVVMIRYGKKILDMTKAEWQMAYPGKTFEDIFMDYFAEDLADAQGTATGEAVKGK